MKLFSLLLIASLSLLLLGCTEDPVLTLKSGNSSIDVPADGCNASITISCNNPWSASTSAAWIKVSPSSGSAGDNNISISVSSNSEAMERQGVVTVQSEGLNINVNVKQAQANAIILSQKDVNISDEGGTFTVNVKSNVNYTVDISNGTGWLENIGSKALTSKDYTFNVKKNEEYDDRTAVITFKDASSGISESVTVHQAQKGAIILSKDSVQVPVEGGSIEVELKASLEYKIEIISSSQWVKQSDTKALNTYMHTFSVSANETYDSRSAVVVFSSISSNLTDTLTILQAHRNGLIVSEREKYIDANGGTVDVELQSNVEYNIIMPTGATWLNHIDTKGLETNKHSFSVEKNETYDDRSTSIIFRSKDGTLADTLFVTQRQMNALILTQKTYSLDDDAHDISVKIRSNIDYTVEIAEGVDWVKEVSTKALKEYSHTFHVASNPSHAIRSTAVYFKSDNSQLIDSLIIEQGLSGVVNLSSIETANCYIVEKEGVYSFIATTIGNGNKGIMAGYHFHTGDATISPAAVKLLWQDHEVVSNVTLQNGRVFFNASSEKGNAVIAVTDASGTILWSWHIWATDRPEEIRLSEATRAYLDRNLGATTAQLGLETTKGLYYQWGRKDPFSVQSRSVGDITAPLTANLFIENPTTMYYPDNSSDWIENSYAYWGNPDGDVSFATYKTIYDPCPIGYTIPPVDAWYEYPAGDIFEGSPFYSRQDKSISIIGERSGVVVSRSGKHIDYPSDASLMKDGFGVDGFYMNAYYFRNSRASAMQVYPSGEGYDCGLYLRYNAGYSTGSKIRCVKEEHYAPFPPTVETQEASQVKITDMVLNGKITNNGNSPVTAQGFYWGLSQNDLNHRVEGSLNAHLVELPVHAAVYYRAFAENESGRGYGNIMVAQLKTATEYAQTVLDSLSILMSRQYSDYGQGFNGEGTIRLYYGDYPGNSLSVNLPGWKTVINSELLIDKSSKYTNYPLRYYYRIINKVNSTIDNYLPYADASDPNIDHYKGALLGFRAYAYTMLVQLYCKSWDNSGNGSSSGLPLRINTADDVTSFSTLGEVYSQIYKDLDLAIDLMKNSGILRSHVHEIDLRTIYAIYAKAALNRKDYSKALDYAKLARADHSLMSNLDYNSGFNGSNPEWIWGAHERNNWQEYTLYFYSFFAYMGYNASASAVRNYPKCISKELFNKIPGSDVRRKLFLDPTGYSYNSSTGEASSDLRNYGYNYARTDGRQGLYNNAKVYAYMQFKFADTFQPGGGQQNIIRAAEMVLIEAEANYFQGNENETRNLLVYLNKQSERDKEYQCNKTGAELFNELKFYRRLELWGEGFDWFDTKRWGDPISRKSFSNGGNFIEEFAGTWSASKKNDFVWVMPEDYEQYVRTGNGL